MNIRDKIIELKQASYELSMLSSSIKNQILNDIADSIKSHSSSILYENKKDITMYKNTLSESMLSRLSLDDNKINSIVQSIYSVIKLDDPIGEIIESFSPISNKLEIKKVRVPFGLISCIYESRPNVTIDICVLSLKTGNACILKGGKESLNTNTFIINLFKSIISKYLSVNCFEYVSRREELNEILTNKNVDLVIPRGGKNLIDYVVNNSLVPVIQTGAGVCHIYVDSECDDNLAINIIDNAKTSNPSVCNAVETILINEKKAYLLTKLKNRMKNVIFRGDKYASQLIDCEQMDEEEYDTEYNALVLSVKIVKNIDEAILHIEKHSTHHSESIISSNDENIEKFMNVIDSACIYSNASTRFTDGGCFGFGTEVGISTGKMHARGPMGLKELTTYKYKIYGKGQIR